MLGHGTKFGHKKEQAIAALLFYNNLDAAARAVGISANTLQRWTKDPEFDAAYREARRVAYRESIERLQAAAKAAVTTVLKIMVDSKTPTATRLRAAEIVLSQGAKAMEMEEIEARVAELERARLAQRSRKRATIVALIEHQSVPGPTTTPVQISAVPPLAAPKQRK